MPTKVKILSLFDPIMNRKKSKGKKAAKIDELREMPLS
jgi:hypothetical protein